MVTDDDLRAVIRRAHLIAEEEPEPNLRSVTYTCVLRFLLQEGEGPPPQAASRAPPSGTVTPKPSSRKVNTRNSPEGPSSWVTSLRLDNFFRQPKTITDVVTAIKALGHNVESKDVTYPLEQLARSKTLRREKLQAQGSKRRVWTYTEY
jgi:hypothetical protein